MRQVPLNSISETDLLAYLDGTAPHPVAEQIASDPELRARLRDLVVSRAMENSQTRLAICKDHPPEFLALPERPNPGQLRGGQVLVAFVLAITLVVATIALSGLSQRSVDLIWVETLVNTHVIRLQQDAAPHSKTASTTTALIARFSEEFALPLDKALNFQTADFEHAHPMFLQGRPVLELAYHTPDQDKLFFCMTFVADQDRAPQTEFVKGIAATYWIKNGMGFVVMGGAQSGRTLNFAAEALAHL